METTYVGLNHGSAEPAYITLYHVPEKSKHIRPHDAPPNPVHVSSNPGPVEPEYDRRRSAALQLSPEYVGRGPTAVEAETEYVRPRRQDYVTKERTRVPAYDPRESTEYHQQRQSNHWIGYDPKDRYNHLSFDDDQHRTNSVENVYVTPRPANAKRRKNDGAQELKKYAKDHVAMSNPPPAI